MPSVGGGAAVYSRACAHSARLLGGPHARWAVAEERSASAALRGHLRASGLEVRPHQVAALAYLSALIATVVVAPLGAVVVLRAHLPMPLLILSVLLPLAMVPLLALSAAVAYPRLRAAAAMRAEVAQGALLVEYLVLALQLQPSLPQALRFAGSHLPAPLGRRVRALQWGVLLHDSESFEAAFLQLAAHLGPHADHLRQALYVVRTAALETTAEGRERKLDQALNVVLHGQQEALRTYASGLGAPLSALFALGVLLPLVLGTMLPLAAIVGVGLSAPLVAALLVGAVPGACALMGVSLLRRRPPMEVPSPDPPLSPLRRGQVAALVMLAAAGTLLALAVLPTAPSGLSQLWIAALVLTVALVGGVLGSLRCAAAARTAGQLEQLAAELPDALFAVGSRLTEGQGLQQALRSTADALGQSAGGTFLRTIARRLRLSGSTLGQLAEDPWLGRRYPLPGLPVMLQLLSQATARDGATAGRLVSQLALAMRQVAHLHRSSQGELVRVTSAMRATVLWFAPVVLGVTATLYGTLARTLAASRGPLSGSGVALFGSAAASAVPLDQFLGIAAAYLLVLSLVVGLVLGALEGTRGKARLWLPTATGAPLSVGAFVVVVAVGSVL